MQNEFTLWFENRWFKKYFLYPKEFHPPSSLNPRVLERVYTCPAKQDSSDLISWHSH